jgi:hypothetical protein
LLPYAINWEHVKNSSQLFTSFPSKFFLTSIVSPSKERQAAKPGTPNASNFSGKPILTFENSGTIIIHNKVQIIENINKKDN